MPYNRRNNEEELYYGIIYGCIINVLNRRFMVSRSSYKRIEETLVFERGCIKET